MAHCSGNHETGSNRWRTVSYVVSFFFTIFFMNDFAYSRVLNSNSVVVYYLRSKSKARIGMVKILKEMLSLEAMDKEFLLSNITRITQGKGECSMKTRKK